MVKYDLRKKTNPFRKDIEIEVEKLLETFTHQQIKVLYQTNRKLFDEYNAKLPIALLYKLSLFKELDNNSALASISTTGLARKEGVPIRTMFRWKKAFYQWLKNKNSKNILDDQNKEQVYKETI